MSSPQSAPQRRRTGLLIGAGLVVLLVVAVVVGNLVSRSSGQEPGSAPSPRITVALPTTYPTEPPPSAPLTPQPQASVTPISKPEQVTAKEVPDFTVTPSREDPAALADGAVAASESTYSSRGEDIDVSASEWESTDDAATRAKALNEEAAAKSRLIVTRKFGANGEGTYWYYEKDGIATQVWLIGNVAGTFTGEPKETQELALRLLMQ